MSNIQLNINSFHVGEVALSLVGQSVPYSLCGEFFLKDILATKQSTKLRILLIEHFTYVAHSYMINISVLLLTFCILNMSIIIGRAVLASA